MRVLLIMLALTLAAAAPTFAAAAESSNSDAAGPPVKATMSASDDIDACLMGCLNLDQCTLDRLRAAGWKTPDIVMAAVISMRSGVAIDDVLAQYKSCSNWRDVAKQYNLSVADVMKFRLTSDGDMEAFNTAILTQCYCIAECDTAALRAKGLSWSEICMSATAAVNTGQTIMTIADLRAQGMSWDDIACKFNVAPPAILKPASMRSVAIVTPTPAGAGPMAYPMNVRDYSGNIIMTEDMAERWYKRGYDWIDVAIATNIAMNTGYPVGQVLLLLNSGRTWRELAAWFSVCPEVAFNVCSWPFPHRSIYSQSAEAKNLKMIEQYQVATQMAGAGPAGRGPMPYWLQRNSTSFGSWWCSPCASYNASCQPCAAPCPAPCPDPCPAPCPAPTTSPAPCPTSQ